MNNFIIFDLLLSQDNSRKKKMHTNIFTFGNTYLQYVANSIDIPTLAPEAGSVTGVSDTELTFVFRFVIIVLISIFSDIFTEYPPNKCRYLQCHTNTPTQTTKHKLINLTVKYGTVRRYFANNLDSLD